MIMGNEAMIKLSKKDRKATEVVGADTITPPVDYDEEAYEFVVKTEEKSLATGCPAYIIINGRKYKI